MCVRGSFVIRSWVIVRVCFLVVECASMFMYVYVCVVLRFVRLPVSFFVSF